MKHNLKIRVSKDKCNSGVLVCRQVTVREKLLRFLLGNPVRLTILVPGDSVDEVAIREIKEGGCHCGKNERIIRARRRA